MSSLLRLSVLVFGVVFLSVKSGHGAEIIDGKEVQRNSLPFMALLENKKPTCGGTLIDPRWVLTAAHCTNISKVLLGVHSIKAKEKSRQTRKVKKDYQHPSYKGTKYRNDLRLLKLDKSVKKSKSVNYLPLAKTINKPAAGSICLVAGWGKTKYENKEMSDVLMAVNVTVIDNKICNSKKYYNKKPFIIDSMICAGSSGKSHNDTCKGDSGGPLLCNNVLVGVTSFGVRCGDRFKPGVYSFLSEEQLKWIRTTMKKFETE